MNFIKKLFYKIKEKRKPINEFDALIQESHRISRYSDHSFMFRNYQLEVPDFISVAYQLKECFHDERLKFLTRTESPVIYDCGANVGVSVMYFKELFPNAKIKAFEPDPNIIKYLKKNLSANNIHGVDVIERAVWIDNNGIEFGQEGADGGSVFYDGNKIQIPSIRLKDLLANEKEVDFLKMDIEGAETEVMLDIVPYIHKVKFLYLEYHSWIKNPQNLHQLLEALTNKGFRYYIHSLGDPSARPFFKETEKNGMDIQLDIYAINQTNI